MAQPSASLRRRRARWRCRLRLAGVAGILSLQWRQWRVWLTGLALTLAAAMPTALPAHAAEEIPNGQFFTEALPDRDDGGGFAVQDGQGARLFTAFRQAGGVDALGYPISRRFDFDGNVAQAFQYGILVWDAANNRADL